MELICTAESMVNDLRVVEADAKKCNDFHWIYIA
jgi:hypothetical protein